MPKGKYDRGCLIQPEDAERVRAMCDEGLTDVQIGQAFGCGSQTVADFRWRQGIKKRVKLTPEQKKARQAEYNRRCYETKTKAKRAPMSQETKDKISAAILRGIQDAPPPRKRVIILRHADGMRVCYDNIERYFDCTPRAM